MKKITICIAAAALSLAAAAQEYAPTGDNIKTVWAEEVTPGNVHQEYPRPQMVRPDWKCLNGLWNYAITGKDRPKPTEMDGRILVPFAVESSLSGVGKTVGEDNALWYTTSFDIPKGWGRKNVLLHFDAVDWSAEVWVNGKKAGEHTGGFAPFHFDITNLLKGSGKQSLTVKVLDPTDQDFIPRGKQVKNPHKIWYTPVTGIWQSVWLEPVSKAHIESYYTTPDIDGGKIEVLVRTANLSDGQFVMAELLEGAVGYTTETPATGKVISSGKVKDGKVTLDVPQMNLWSPDSPYLYGLKLKVMAKNGKTVIDEVNCYTSMRKVALGKDSKDFTALTLNNAPLFNYGPLDQGWWPDGLYTAPTDEALKYDLVKTKDFGYNMIRKHIKLEPSRWYFYCDQMGIMVWQDMPSIADLRVGQWKYADYGMGTDAAVQESHKQNYYKEWAEIMDVFRTFNCITVWVPFNEAWGQFDTEKVVEFTRAIDNTRLINPASGGNHKENCGDMVDCHHYPNPQQYIWSPTLANVVGEYGGIGRPIEGHLWQKDKNWGYIQYDTAEKVTDVYERYALQLIDLIGRGCSGAVYTQTTDVEGEVNGLITYDRKVIKVIEERIREINERVIDSLK